jgi:hypothetical protein
MMKTAVFLLLAIHIASCWDLHVVEDRGTARVDDVIPNKWPIHSFESFSADIFISILEDVPGRLNFDYRETSGRSPEDC